MKKVAANTVLSHPLAGLPVVGKVAHEADMRVTPRSRIRYKVVIFETQHCLLQFWGHFFRYQLPDNALAAVRDVSTTVWGPANGGTEYLRVDPKYFAVVGLVDRHITTNVLAHEAAHLAYAYDRRMGKRNPFIDPHNHEEQLAYPVGIITQQLTDLLVKLHDTGVVHSCREGENLH